MTLLQLLLCGSFISALTVFCTILIRQLFSKPFFFILASFCLISGMNSLAHYFEGEVLEPLITLLSFITILILFRSAVSSSLLKRVIDFLIVSFTSVATTIFILTGMIYAKPIGFIEDSIILSLALILLLEQIKLREIFIFQYAEFWIAIGSIVYYFMACFSMLIVEFTPAEDLHRDRVFLLLIVQIIQFGLYLFSAAMPKNYLGRKKETETLS